jgi:DMSO/TMAO reductase YedYZ molybdopterin-dependent catalytic subunit
MKHGCKGGRSMDPRKSKPFLITRSLSPENQESPIHFLKPGLISSKYFYRRNHFSYPPLSEQNFFLPIQGKVTRPITFHYLDLLNMPAKTMDVVLECAGNNRSKFRPKVFGEQWEEGAISQGRWKGVPLKYLLSITGILDQAKEVVFEGHDFGKRTDLEGAYSFSRSLPLDKALHPDTFIAYEYNGKPIPFKHGYPLRLIVPQWYAMASVKWLKKITIIDHLFQGPFQTIDYIYYPNKENENNSFPVTTMNIRSMIQQPSDYSVIDQGIHSIKGIAWTGEGNITKVQLSFDYGKHWHEAMLQQDPFQKYSWTQWIFTWQAVQKGEYTILSRATDSKGRMQPMEPMWNQKGYGYNAISKIHVKVE